MSGATAKATRREIRRAVGEDGLAAVNQTAATVHSFLAPTTQQHSVALEHHAQTLKQHERQLADYHERLERLEADAKAFAALTFPQRLRWVMQALF